MEVWKPIPGWPGYEASSHGNIRRPGYIVEQRMYYTGYMHVRLYDAYEKGHQVPVHPLVLGAFVPKPTTANVICCHANGYPNDNSIGNLYWGTSSDNSKDIAIHKPSRLRYKVKLEILYIDKPGYKRMKKQYRLIRLINEVDKID